MSKKKDKQKRADECSKEIQKVLEKYECQLVPSLVMAQSGYNFNVQVATKE